MSAALLAALLLSSVQEYEALLAEGIAAGRAGRLEEARRLLFRAFALDPARPEALVERGGVELLEGRYDAAAAALEAALDRRDEPYARGLLAAALHLGGRPDEALAHWNRLGQPRLRRLSILGLERTRDRVARREIALREGELVRLGEVRRTRLQLREAGVCDGVRLRSDPLGQGRADVEVALVERRGFARSWLELGVASGVAAAQGRAVLRYANIAGEGIAVGGEYRWQQHRPQVSASVAWPRPFGVGAYLAAEGFRGRQLYDVGSETLARRRGFGIGFDRVLGPSSVGGLRLRSVTRRFDGGPPSAKPGRVQGLELRVEHQLVEAGRLRLGAGLSVFAASAALGSDVGFTRATARLRAALAAVPAGDADAAAWTLAVQLSAGISSARTPFDEAFAPGASPEMELPLRGRQQAVDGILGRSPLARRLAVGNVEWRRRLVARDGVRLGAVVFYDGAWLGHVVGAPGGALHDIGFGMRLGIAGASLLRFDLGHGLTDGRNAVSVGLGQSF